MKENDEALRVIGKRYMLWNIQRQVYALKLKDRTVTEEWLIDILDSLEKMQLVEEDIERLKLCSSNQCHICGRYEKEECMLERNRCEQHILSAYKRVLKEAERYKNMYKAEHEIHLVRNEQLDRKENAITRCKELENENKTIKEANNYWKSRYCEISNNSIPIQKVKNKIEEIGEKIKYEENEKVVIYLHKQKNILQELLESEE